MEDDVDATDGLVERLRGIEPALDQLVGAGDLTLVHEAADAPARTVQGREEALAEQAGSSAQEDEGHLQLIASA